MKDAYYFPHDSNARNDLKLVELRCKYDWWGYGVYFAIVEILREQSDYEFSCKKTALLSGILGIDKDKLAEFIKDCVELGLFSNGGEVIYSPSLKNRMMFLDKKREAGRRAANNRWGNKTHKGAVVQPALPTPNAKKEVSKEVEEEKEEKKGYKHKDKIKTIIAYFNEKAGTKFKDNSSKLDHLNARIEEGYPMEDFEGVIDLKVSQWSGDDKMRSFLRPETLFGTKFDGYVNEVVIEKGKDKLNGNIDPEIGDKFYG